MTTSTLPRIVENLRSITYTLESSTRPGLLYIVCVDADGWHCNCPDATYRRRQCKHIRQAQAGNAGEPIIDCDRVGHPRRIVEPARIGIADQSRPVSVDDLYA